jgi:hypothetical protein
MMQMHDAKYFALSMYGALSELFLFMKIITEV